MNMKIRSDREMQELAGGDEQHKLVTRICDLAYQINHASFADVVVTVRPTTLHVEVNRYFQNTPAIDRTFGLSIQGVINVLLMSRLRRVAEELELVLKEGNTPRDGAA